jgi:cation:H+ antiporter
MAWVLTAFGFVLLVVAGDFLVRGAVNLSLRLGIPALIVSLTIVAFGTSAPELLVAIQAATQGVSGIAMGNVVGSNIANVLLVLGVPALISTMDTGGSDSRKSFVFMVGLSVLFIALAFTGQFGLWQGLVLLAALALVLGENMYDARRQMQSDDELLDDLEGADPALPMWKILLFLLLGLIGLPLGANILVDAASEIARNFGVSDTVIGLTLVAIGTSLPELATTVMAAIRKQADVALGNVIGSNLFNLAGIIGVASLVAPISVAPEFLTYDLWVMLGVSVLMAPFVFLGWRLGRRWGIVLLALYASYLVTLL